MDLSLLIAQWSGQLPEGFIRPWSPQVDNADARIERGWKAISSARGAARIGTSNARRSARTPSMPP